MNPRIVATISIVLGLICLGLSLAWPAIARPPSDWDEAAAAEHTQAGADFHRLSFAGDGQPTAEQQAALLEAQRKWERSQAELQKLQRRPGQVARGLRIAGICLAVFGAILSWSAKT